MNGPAAPKDPEKKRPYFYIMKDKEIFGAKQEDGSAIHFIYESDGRLINSAQIVGNITDENMLRALLCWKHGKMRWQAIRCRLSAVCWLLMP